MSTAAHTAHDRTARAPSLLDRHYFLLRRLHSLFGIAPIGFFLFPHLFTNSSIVWGRWASPSSTLPGEAQGVQMFQHEVNWIHNLPGLILIEIGLLWLPLAYHAAFGFYYARQGRTNTSRYGYQANARYSWQRITGYIAFLFVFFHIASLRWGWTFGGLFPTFDPAHAASSTAEHFQNGRMGLAVSVFYLVCVLAVVFHFANGLWTAAITWGLTLSDGAMRRWGQVCASIGIVLALAAVLAVYGFSTLNIAGARETELHMLGSHIDGARDREVAPGGPPEHTP